MRTPALPQHQHEIGAVLIDPPTDLQLILHSSWLLAGIAIALAACTVADESKLHQVPPDTNASVAHLAPQGNATSGNVQDMTY
jgi:hypothetical protein